MDELDVVIAAAPERIAECVTLEQLAEIEVQLIGRGSLVAETRKNLAKLVSKQRPLVGAKVNMIVKEIQGYLASRRDTLELLAENELLAADKVDVTLPMVRFQPGTEHILTSTMEEVCDIFAAIGYQAATGPEVETAYLNFDLLNTPVDHPARAESDTLYVEYGDPDDEMLLRTQTSPMQVRYMLDHHPPVHVVVPGRVFRSDTLDPTHSPVFHQVEGLAVDTNITFADLKGTLSYFAREFFGEGQRIKLIPHFFPFTEPSAEMHVSCFVCDRSGCRVCGNSGWIELMGCGMVDPNVLMGVDYDASTLSGFAFGVGVERLAMVRHGVTHIRHFFENDLRVLSQFV